MTEMGCIPASGRFIQRCRGDFVLAFLALLVVAGLFFTTPSILESVDYVLFYKNNFEFLRDSIFGGRLPLWNPYIGTGRPYLADLQSAVFYPPVYLVLLGTGSGTFLLISLHFLLAAFGMRALGDALQMKRPVSYLLALSLVGSLGLTGRLMAGQVLYVCALCYLPLLFVCATRLDGKWSGRLIGGYGLLMGLQFLCGHPQVFWISTLGQLVFAASRCIGASVVRTLATLIRSMTQFILAGTLSLGLTAIVLFPFLELVHQGNRSAPSPEFANFGRLEWLDLFSLITGPPYEKLVDWEKNLFVGGAILISGIAGLFRLRDRNCRALLAVLVFALLISVGDQTPLFRCFYGFLPGFAGFRVHARSAILIVFVLLVSAGLWFSNRRTGAMDWVALALTGGVTLFLLFCYRRELSRPGGTIPLAIWITLACLGLLFLALGLEGRDRRLGGYVLVAVGLLQGIDLFNANLEFKGNYTFLKVQNTSPDFPYQAALVSLLRDSGLSGEDHLPPRVLVPRKIVPANFGMLYHYSSVDAYTSLFLRRPWNYLHRVLDLPTPKMKNTSVAGEIFDRDPFSRPELAVDVGMNRQTGAFVLNPRPAPRVFLVYQTDVVDSGEAAIDRLKAGYDVRRAALVEQPLKPGLADGVSLIEHESRVVRCTPTSITLDIDARADALLVMAEAWYPGWKARIGDSVTESLPANAWMRAFRVPAGHHRVQVFFQQDYLVIGGFTSLFSLITCALLIGGHRRVPGSQAETRDFNHAS